MKPPLRNPRISAKNQNWHSLCNISWHQDRTIRSSCQGVSTMFIAKIQNAAFALAGAVIVASLFIGAAMPVSPIA